MKAITNVGGIALLPAFSRIAGETDRLRAAYLRALQWSMIGAAPLTALMIALGVPAVDVVLGLDGEQLVIETEVGLHGGLLGTRGYEAECADGVGQ